MSNIEMIIAFISSIFESIWNILSIPSQSMDDLASTLLDLTNKYGLDPYYVSTVFVNLITLTYWRSFRNWPPQDDHTKHLAIITLVAAIMLNLLSLLKLLGIIDL